MKKIMFNDKYGLTKAVIEGRKTQTRRIVTHPKTFHGKDVCGFYVCKRVSDGVVTDVCMYDENESFIDEGQILPKYEIGEIVAVAQSYKDLGYSETALDRSPKDWRIVRGALGKSKGWNNKMFVRVDACIEKGHQIRVTKVRIERLQDISDDDCLSEDIVVNEPKIKGGVKSYYPCEYLKSCADKVGWGRVFDTPRKAYAELIDKVSGKGTWESNPYVFVYDFELIK